MNEPSKQHNTRTLLEAGSPDMEEKGTGTKPHDLEHGGICAHRPIFRKSESSARLSRASEGGFCVIPLGQTILRRKKEENEARTVQSQRKGAGVAFQWNKGEVAHPRACWTGSSEKTRPQKRREGKESRKKPNVVNCRWWEGEVGRCAQKVFLKETGPR